VREDSEKERKKLRRKRRKNPNTEQPARKDSTTIPHSNKIREKKSRIEILSGRPCRGNERGKEGRNRKCGVKPCGKKK